MSHLTANPTYQLNLMIALTQPAPEGTHINPVLFKAGFELRSLSPSLPLPVHIMRHVRRDQLPVNQSVSPDLFLESKESSFHLLIECKKSSFSSQSTTAKQARTYLLLSKQVVADLLGKAGDGWESGIAYVLDHGSEHQQRQTLTELAGELNDIGLVTSASVVVWGLDQREDGIYLIGDSKDIIWSHDNGIRVLAAGIGDEPRPLYYIPYDPDVGVDKYSKQVFLEKLRSGFMTMVGHGIGAREYRLSVSELLVKIVPVWDQWEATAAKKSLEKRVRRQVETLLSHLAKEGLRYRREGAVFVIDSAGPEVVTKARRQLQNIHFRKRKFDLIFDPQEKLDFERRRG